LLTEVIQVERLQLHVNSAPRVSVDHHLLPAANLMPASQANHSQVLFRYTRRVHSSSHLLYGQNGEKCLTTYRATVVCAERFEVDLPIACDSHIPTSRTSVSWTLGRSQTNLLRRADSRPALVSGSRDQRRAPIRHNPVSQNFKGPSAIVRGLNKVCH
jgi:hypothetical protein